ncbi:MULTISPECIES: hypothetical protein [unclassified Mesorhizobium]|uniref:hypothetical protein n=1 Tax=unclassified Mesorhizobium TaxID=325217 RepID=UPI0003CF97ED|nr:MULTISPECIES: hypothetical protein [unclassified Mesorhizobium]ESY61294.1 hypothetical protein X744_06070 [Mesorhizobium sp. LNJC372A00]WJI80812.1 hypothetical protein NLY34_29005 [Mesorhizobium sp. C374B]WJI87351.1 hypothetical protein NLY42_31400 [Mesorhizobium sp. C372A]
MPLKRMRCPWISIVSPSIRDATPVIGAGFEPNQFDALWQTFAVLDGGLRDQSASRYRSHQNQAPRHIRPSVRTAMLGTGSLSPAIRSIVVSVFVHALIPAERMRLFQRRVQKTRRAEC